MKTRTKEQKEWKKKLAKCVDVEKMNNLPKEELDNIFKILNSANFIK